MLIQYQAKPVEDYLKMMKNRVFILQWIFLSWKPFAGNCGFFKHLYN